jgi:hypothetical protein
VALKQCISPRAARHLTELARRSGPLREAQAMNTLANAAGALRYIEAQTADSPGNSTVVAGKVLVLANV